MLPWIIGDSRREPCLLWTDGGRVPVCRSSQRRSDPGHLSAGSWLPGSHSHWNLCCLGAGLGRWNLNKVSEQKKSSLGQWRLCPVGGVLMLTELIILPHKAQRSEVTLEQFNVQTPLWDKALNGISPSLTFDPRSAAVWRACLESTSMSLNRCFLLIT